MATKRLSRQTSGTDQHERLVVGWFSFTCCEDSTILLTELLNDHFDEWKKVNERIRWYLSHFDYGREVKSLGEVIRVDDMVRGCPMKVPAFIQTLNKFLELFGIGQHA